MNKNDNPINDIDKKININSFTQMDYFDKIAIIESNIEKESLIIKEIIDERYITQKNLVYLFVIDGFIQKVGSTTQTMKDRISSYNCGKKLYRKNGTCSTTNFFVLQSFLNIGKQIDIYAFFPGKKKEYVDIFGDIILKDFSMPSKDCEKILLNQLKERKVMPILCTQT